MFINGIPGLEKRRPGCVDLPLPRCQTDFCLSPVPVLATQDLLDHRSMHLALLLPTRCTPPVPVAPATYTTTRTLPLLATLLPALELPPTSATTSTLHLLATVVPSTTTPITINRLRRTTLEADTTPTTLQLDRTMTTRLFLRTARPLGPTTTTPPVRSNIDLKDETSRVGIRRSTGKKVGEKKRTTEIERVTVPGSSIVHFCSER
jgi:hypothetical protein